MLWSAQRMSVAQIAEIAFTSPDRVREVIHNFNADGFDSLAPEYAGGRPPTFTLPQRQQIKKIALARPTDHDLAFSTWKQSNDALFEAKKNRILELYAIVDGNVEPGEHDPTVVICVDEFGPLDLQPHPGKQWAPTAAGKGDTDSPRRRRMRATYTRPHGVRHMMGAYDLSTDRL